MCECAQVGFSGSWAEGNLKAIGEVEPTSTPEGITVPELQVPCLAWLDRGWHARKRCALEVEGEAQGPCETGVDDPEACETSADAAHPVPGGQHHLVRAEVEQPRTVRGAG